MSIEVHVSDMIISPKDNTEENLNHIFDILHHLGWLSKDWSSIEELHNIPAHFSGVVYDHSEEEYVYISQYRGIPCTLQEG